MKAVVETKKQEVFEPITLTITLETVEEARLMIHLANSGKLRDSLKDEKYYSPSSFDMSLPMSRNLHGANLWNELNNIFQERGIEV